MEKDNGTYTDSDDDNLLVEEEVLCCVTRGLNPLFYYTENDKQYDLQPFTHYIDDKYLYISRNVANRYYRYSLVSARKKRMRIPLRMKDDNIVLARADLLTSDNQYLTRTKDVAKYLNHVTQQNNTKQHVSCCNTAAITTALTIMSTILIALVLNH